MYKTVLERTYKNSEIAINIEKERFEITCKDEEGSSLVSHIPFGGVLYMFDMMKKHNLMKTKKTVKNKSKGRKGRGR